MDQHDGDRGPDLDDIQDSQSSSAAFFIDAMHWTHGTRFDSVQVIVHRWRNLRGRGRNKSRERCQAEHG
jgi:hypothetical protein